MRRRLARSWRCTAGVGRRSEAFHGADDGGNGGADDALEGGVDRSTAVCSTGCCTWCSLRAPSCSALVAGVSPLMALVANCGVAGVQLDAWRAHPAGSGAAGAAATRHGLLSQEATLPLGCPPLVVDWTLTGGVEVVVAALDAAVAATVARVGGGGGDGHGRRQGLRRQRRGRLLPSDTLIAGARYHRRHGAGQLNARPPQDAHARRRLGRHPRARGVLDRRRCSLLIRFVQVGIFLISSWKDQLTRWCRRARSHHALPHPCSHLHPPRPQQQPIAKSPALLLAGQ